MARNITFLGLPRYKLVGPVFGVSSVVGMEPTKLGNWEPWDVARIASIDPAKTYLDSRIELPLSYYGPTLQVGGVGYANHNMGLGATARTILLGPDATDYLPVRLAPDAVVETGGSWDGDHLDVDDDPYAPDANVMTLTSVGGSVKFTFPTPAEDPTEGEDLQTFRIRCTYDEAPQAFVVELWENNVQVEVLEVFLPTGSDPTIPSDRVISVYWDAALLSIADGSLVELKIGVVKADVGDTFELEAVDWLPQIPPSGDDILADSGWQPATSDQVDTEFGSTAAGSVGIAPQQTFGHLFGSNIEGVYRFVTFFRDPLNTVGYIDLGECVASATFTPRINREWGDFVTMTPRDKVVQSEGGSRFGVRREPLRGMPIPLGNLSKAEAHSVLDRLHRAGTLYPWMVFLFHDDAVERRHTSLYGCAHNLPRIAGRSIDYRSATFDFVEKL